MSYEDRLWTSLKSPRISMPSMTKGKETPTTLNINVNICFNI